MENFMIISLKSCRSNLKKILIVTFFFVNLVFNTPQIQGMDYLTAASNSLGSMVQDHKLALASTCAAVGMAYYYRAAQAYKPLKWNWQALDYQQPQQFPAGFLWGTATSAHQVEGNCTNNTWSAWEKERDENGKSRVESPSGLACDHWNRYKDDIQLMKKLGVNAYRFSVEWSKIEPKEGVFDENALKHYEEVCQELVENGIQPCITLHHYTDPLWFMDKYGFEKTENIQDYVHYTTTVIRRLHRFNPLWFTFNSPDGYAAQGYLTCSKPAGRLIPKKDMQLCSEVFKNLLEAHVQTYCAIKADKEYKTARIGILKNMFQLDPYSIYNPFDILACFMGKKVVDTCFYEFFTTGKFKTYIPFKISMDHSNAQAVGALDFIGINYYSHGCMKNFKVVRHDDEETTNNDRYTIYAEGLYRAIKEMSAQVAKPLNVPMYITENGIATEDDAKRDRFLKKYLFAAAQAIKDGFNLCGYMYWSFMDNYEWGQYNKKYGIYKVDFATQERTLRPGSQFYLDTIKANTKN
jgi:beta-glucosidase